MKFLLFADLHHHPGVFMGGTWDDLALMQRRAEEENCDFIIHAGDFCHGPSNVPEYTRAYNDFHIPSYHVLGNHDTDDTPLDETLQLYKMPAAHYYFDCGGYRIIATDPNYYLLEGKYIHYDMGNYYAYGSYRDYMPPEQLAWLEKTIAESPYPCIIISHSSFERLADGVKNQMDVQRIINDANRRNPHSVLMCINGHHHRDNIRILENVCYLDMNSVSFDWVNEAHDCYPEDLCREIRLMNHTVVYNDPLYAVITLDGNRITIEGTESTMFMGINREHTTNPVCDRSGRPVVPKVQSANITLD